MTLLCLDVSETMGAPQKRLSYLDDAIQAISQLVQVRLSFNF